MPELTPKQEAFANYYVKLGNASEAYRRAYDSKAKADSVHVNASKLLSDAKVSLRVKEIKEDLRISRRATLDDILDELEEARQVALDLQQPAAMNQSSLGKAKILGFDKQVVDHVSTDGSMSPKSIDQDLVSALTRKLTE